MYMSLLGFDSAGSATINGLTEINANNVFSDVLYYDAGTVPVNVKTAIDGITVDVTALEADVLTLQGEMNAVEADVATLQGEMNDVEADVATLQGEMNDVEADVAALIVSTGVTAATVAGLVVSQAAQDVTIASHTVSIAALELEDLSLDTRIDALEQKTTDQSWGSLTGTSFSTKVNVGGGSGVVLNTASASEFNSGITTDLIQSVTNNNLIIEGRGTGDAILKTSGTDRITCFDNGAITIAGSSGNPMNITTTGNLTLQSASGTSITIGSSQTSGILNIATGTSRTGAVNIATGATTTSTAISIGNQTGSFGSVDIGSTTISIGKQNCANNNIGTAINGTLNLKTGSGGGAVNMGTGMTSGAITIGKSDATASTTTIDINTGSAMTGAINIGSGASGKPITIGSSASTNTINGTTTIAGTTNINTTTFSNTSIGNGAAGGNFTVNAAANSITGTTNTLTSTGETEINCVALDINATGALTADSSGGMTFTEASGSMTFTKTGASGGMSFNSDNFVLFSAVDEFLLTGGGHIETVSTGADALVQGYTTVDIQAITGDVNIRSTNTDVTIQGDQLLITTDTAAGTGIVHTSVTTGYDFDGKNNVGSYGMRLSETGTGGLVLAGIDTGTSTIETIGAAHSLNVTGGQNLNLTATTGEVYILAATTLDLASGGTMTIDCGAGIRQTAVTEIDLQINGNTRIDILDTTVTINPTTSIVSEINGSAKETITSTTTTLTNTNLELNGLLLKPLSIGTYASQSSYSTTSITPLTTYLGGTLESVKTFTNSASGTFRYIMASVSPFNGSGGITLTAGTYMFWLAVNFEDASAFNLTDLRMGLTNISTLTTASSEATIVASLPNLTCYFHKTDAADAVASDSEQRVLSSCFRIASSTTVYPFYDANHSVTVDTVTCTSVFVKIGSA